MRKLGTGAAVVILLRFFLVGVSAQGDPEVIVDGYLARAERLIAAEDHEGALRVLDNVVTLQGVYGFALPDEFHYVRAQVASAAGSLDVVIEAARRYLTAAGRSAEFSASVGDLLEEAETEVTRGLAEQGDASAQNELGERYENGRGVVRDYREAVSWFRRAAEQGHARGQGNLGAMYANGTGVPRDDEAALMWWRRAVEQDDARGQNGLGNMYERGRSVREDPAEALRWYRLAAEQGYARGQSSLGFMYSTGRGVQRNDAEAVRWFRRAAEQGHANGQRNLGAMYANGRGVQRDDAEAVRWFRRAAEQGHANGQRDLGAMYANGRGVQHDDAEAVRWYRRAAEQGHANGQSNLGFMYSTGRGVQRNDAEAVRWFRRAAEQGHANGQRNLGAMYANGRGVQRDDAEAVRWYRRAAEQGHANGQRDLGAMYANGRGVQHDDAEAVRWYRRAAEQGHANGQSNLGFMYSTGRGVQRDDAEAVRWYRRAAEQGHANGQNNLGFMYENGRGVREDAAEATRWYRRAASQGHARAQENLVALAAAASDPPVDGPLRVEVGTVFRGCGSCPEMVVLPAGRFRMGCVSGRDCQDEAQPMHEVAVAAFALSKYEVTFEQYDHFARTTGYRRPDDFGWGRGRRPVMDVSWDDAAAYAEWLSSQTGERYRLPSEAEWEYAARAGGATRYGWGNEIGYNRANCDGCGSRWDDDRTAPVGSFEANAWGLHDMHGNVSEWVQDCWHDSYSGAPRDGSAWVRRNGRGCGFGPDVRVVRGGSWDYSPWGLRAVNRSFMPARADNLTVGFRVARTLN